MDYKFLDKVVDQIVSETTIDYDRKVIGTPLHFIPFDFFSPSFTSSIYPLIFSKHCRDVYGLNKQEIEYVWEEYRNIIKDKIENNG